MGSVQSTDKSDKTPKARSSSSDKAPEQQQADSAAPGDSATPPPELSVASPAPRSPSPAGDQYPPPEPLPQATEEDMAEVAAATKPLLDTKGGKSLEILLSPAVKKPKSRVSPPTSPTAVLTQEAIQLRLKEAEGRKKSIEEERVKSLAAQLAKIEIAAQKREEVEKEKVEKIQEALESKLSAADENKAKVLSEVKDKVSQHMSKIEKAQKELEASIEAARQAAETSLTEKMDKNEELKSLQMEETLKKIKEHQEHVEKVRTNQEEKLKPYVEDLQTNIRAKEERARQNLEKKDAELRNKLAEQSRHAEAVRQNKEKIQADGGAPDQTTESA